MSTIYDKAIQIKCLTLDLDGVLTDGGLYLNDKGEESRRFNITDGFGIKLLKALGFHVCIITGSNDAVVRQRMHQLGIEHYYTKCIHKLEPYEDLKQKLNLKDHEIAFMGDDYQDLVLLKRVGLSFAPANAIDPVKNQVDIVTQASGGHGAVREVSEFFIHLHNQSEAIINYFNQYPCKELDKIF